MPSIRQGIYDLLQSVSIDTKESGRTHVTPWPSQRIVIDAICKGLSEDIHEFVVLKCRQVACCLHPTTRVLTADLRWVPIGNLIVGDEVVAVDEFPTGGRGAGRKMKTASVQAVVRMSAPTYRITFNDGRSVVCTGNHPWLSRKEGTEWHWRSIQRTARGGRAEGNCLTIGTKVRWITQAWDAADYEDGWFGGLLDGEGSIANENATGAKLTISQLHGPVFRRMEQYLASRGYNYGVQNENKPERVSKFGRQPVPKLVVSRTDEVFRLIGQTRPSRFLGRRFWENRECPGKKSGVGWAEIVNIQPLGEQPVIDLQTTAGTYIAEGFVSHNTTVCSVVELFWCLANPGVQGAIIADRTDNLERLRRIFANLLDTLPPEWRGPDHRLVVNNRNSLAFGNRSVIDLLAAANNPDLGASRALNMAHMTECSLWKSLAGVESLRASLARENPMRLYVWESIANGFNWFYDHCQNAKKDTRHMKFIFLGFWSNPTYSIPRDDEDYKTYWDGSLTDDELTRARYCKQEYNVTVKPEQIAWWRRENEYHADEYMFRHYPWTEKECFIASGHSFFPAARTLELSEALAVPPPYQAYKYEFTDHFLDSTIEQTQDPAEAMLRVWEPPEPGGVYAIGCDPSGGGGGEADDHAIQVLRCYADRSVQVAEFQSNKPLTYQIAWVLAHLCGAYRDHICNLEVTGIGAAVLPEIRNLRQLAEQGLMMAVPGFEDTIKAMIGNVRWFLYKRQDTMTGAGNIQNWKTNADNKSMIFSALRDSLNRGHNIEIRSVRCMRQLQGIVEDNGWIGAGQDSSEGDDLVMSLVLAHWTWIEWYRNPLVARKMTWDSQHGERPPQNAGTVLNQAYTEFFQGLHRRRRVGSQVF